MLTWHCFLGIKRVMLLTALSESQDFLDKSECFCVNLQTPGVTCRSRFCHLIPNSTDVSLAHKTLLIRTTTLWLLPTGLGSIWTIQLSKQQSIYPAHEQDIHREPQGSCGIWSGNGRCGSVSAHPPQTVGGVSLPTTG
ncbi:hypothetical protein CRENBAI_025218 [Crenichthys baileyi]|uniref:Uncharacterized protein n=1 Tax=Crenichthys baileyi TaxID=28760 RepID=A0AAV9QXL7_9TELE